MYSHRTLSMPGNELQAKPMLFLDPTQIAKHGIQKLRNESTALALALASEACYVYSPKLFQSPAVLHACGTEGKEAQPAESSLSASASFSTSMDHKWQI